MRVMLNVSARALRDSPCHAPGDGGKRCLRRRICPHKTCAGRDNGGFIIVAVLWMLGALATLASIYAVYVINTAISLSVNDDRLKAEALMRSALELTAYRISSADAEVGPSSGEFIFTLGKAKVTVAFRSEAARIDLNMASKQFLAGLFLSLGVSNENAAFYTDRVIAWRTPPDPDQPDTETPAYSSARLGYGPRRAPFTNVYELSLVLGLPPTLVERALPLVTVFSGRPGINIMDAAPEVLAALPGMTPERLSAVLSERGRGPQAILYLLSFFATGVDQMNTTAEASKAMRVRVWIDLESKRRVHGEAVILMIDDAEELYRILSWRDDLDGPS
jgi:general secretion pathway protein K